MISTNQRNKVPEEEIEGKALSAPISPNQVCREIAPQVSFPRRQMVPVHGRAGGRLRWLSLPGWLLHSDLRGPFPYGFVRRLGSFEVSFF